MTMTTMTHFQPQSQPPIEDITTIFVVGFPEDIQEREFQNMFVFAPGFEAATLKMPQPEEEIASRRQIIGFAKFRTKSEALEAIEVLNGRKVDAERVCILKAEMAKKNLHTKRHLQDYYSKYYYRHAYGFDPYYGQYGMSSYGLNEGGELAFLPSDLGIDLYGGSEVQPERSLATYMEKETTGSLSNSANELATSDAAARRKFNCFSGIDPLARSCISDIIQDEAAIAEPSGFNYSIFSSNTSSLPTSNGSTNGSTTPKNGSDNPLAKSLDAYFASAAAASFPTLGAFSTSVTMPSAGSLVADENMYPGQSLSIPLKFQQHAVRPVPSDQENPPCNTLYVGNLPMDASEDELRAIFSHCPGYRRMLFKIKSNGPMCFVEFDSVPFASQAMNELYGYPLSNSTKGTFHLVSSCTNHASI